MLFWGRRGPIHKWDLVWCNWIGKSRAGWVHPVGDWALLDGCIVSLMERVHAGRS